MKRTKEEAELTRKSLIETAFREFLETGFEESTLEGIAEKAGVTRGAIYWHFKNKYHLLESLIEIKDLESLVILKDIYKLDIPPLKKLKKLVETGMLSDIREKKILSNYVRMKVELYNYFIKYGDKRNLSGTFMKYLISTLRAARKTGEIKTEINIHTAAYTLYCLMAGAIVRFSMAPERFKSVRSMRKLLNDYIKLIENK